MSFKLPKSFIKKIFPPKKSVSIVDTTNDGKADSIQIQALNLIQPFRIPENIDLGDFDLKDFDLSEYGEIKIDDEPIDISKSSINLEMLRERIKIYHKREAFNLDDILGGKAGGRLIAMGDKLTILFKLDDADLAKVAVEGKHTFSIESESIPTLEIGFELTNENMNVKFDLSKT